MRGIIEARGEGQWRVRAYAGRENGKVRWVSRTVHGGKRVAQTELAKLVAEVEGGEVVASHPVTLGELIDRWLSDIAPHRTLHTMKEYRRIADANVKPALGNIEVSKLTARLIEGFYTSLTKRGLSSASVRRHHALLHAALGRAVKWGVVAANPVDRATPPGLKRPTASAPSVDDVQRLIAEAETIGDHVLACAVALGAVTGARRGELCALRWSDIDWDRRVVRIARSLTVIKRQVTAGPTKTHQVRLVAIDTVLEAFLMARRGQQEEYAASIGAQLCDDPYVLSRTADGAGPCLPDGLTSAYGRLASRLGISGHLHELRHFAATTAIAAGTDVRTVAGRLGHADPSVTLRVYAHALEQRDRELGALLGEAVLGTKNRQRSARTLGQNASRAVVAPDNADREDG
jgi:integrase